jgi:hypothetical protein
VALCAAGIAGGARAATQLDPTVAVAFEERFDNDAALVTEAGEAQLQSKLLPQLGFWLRDHTYDASAWYSPAFLYRHGSGTFAVDHRGHGVLKLVLSERAAADLGIDAWRVSDPTSLPRLGMARQLVPIRYARGHVGTQFRVAPRWNVGVAYALEGALIEDGQSVPGWVHAPMAEAWYRLNGRADLGAEWRLQQFSFGFEQATAQSGVAQVRYRFSPITTGRFRVGPGVYSQRGMPTSLYPRVVAEVGRDGQRFDLAVQAGHDLIGASGFTAALWADFASVVADYWLAAPLKVTVAANYYRNGLAPDVGYWPLQSPASAQGYALGAAVDWHFNAAVAIRVQADRYAQVAVAPEAGAAMNRTVIAARVVITPWGTSARGN